MKDFSDFLSLVDSPEGEEALLRGTSEIFEPRRYNLRTPGDLTKLFSAMHQASVQSTLNLLWMYHEWLRDSDEIE